MNNKDLILDGTKISWYKERIIKWEKGERIAPITIEMALTQTCNYSCEFCYATLQKNQGFKITKEVMINFLDDCKELGVKGVCLIGDGESTISPIFEMVIVEGSKRGLAMGVGTNAFALNRSILERILPHLTYLRVNFSAGERKRYAEIMGVPEVFFDKVCTNIKDMMQIKKDRNLKVTIGMQMVCMPQYKDQIIPLAKLGRKLMPDYLVIKHCSDDPEGSLGVDYNKYDELTSDLLEAEKLSYENFRVHIKWSKISSKGTRSYQRCYGPPFLLQLSGTGLVAPCGFLFSEKYKRFHIGNIVTDRLKDIIKSDAYWEVINFLASEEFNAQDFCATLCMQHKVNEYLDEYKKGNIVLGNLNPRPEHIEFI